MALQVPRHHIRNAEVTLLDDGIDRRAYLIRSIEPGEERMNIAVVSTETYRQALAPMRRPSELVSGMYGGALTAR